MPLPSAILDESLFRSSGNDAAKRIRNVSHHDDSFDVVMANDDLSASSEMPSRGCVGISITLRPKLSIVCNVP